MTKSAEKSTITHINENRGVVKIDSKIYSQGEGSDSPGGFRFLDLKKRQELVNELNQQFH